MVVSQDACSEGGGAEGAEGAEGADGGAQEKRTIDRMGWDRACFTLSSFSLPPRTVPCQAGGEEGGCAAVWEGEFAIVRDEGSGKQWLYKNVDGRGNIAARLASSRIKPRLIDAEFTCEKELGNVIHSPRLRKLLPKSKHSEPSLP
jgi:hypothetical protein